MHWATHARDLELARIISVHENLSLTVKLCTSFSICWCFFIVKLASAVKPGPKERLTFKPIPVRGYLVSVPLTLMK